MDDLKKYNLTFKAQDYAEKDNIATFKVIASKANVMTSHNILFKKNAYQDAIKKLQEDKKRKMLPMYFNHNDDDIIGGFPVTSIEEVGDDLLMSAEINLEVSSAKEKYALIKQGVITDMSVGVRINPEDVSAEKNGTLSVNKVDKLFEVSLVSAGANDQAVITQFSKEKIEKFTIRDCEECLKALGLSNSGSKTFISQLKKCLTSEQRDVAKMEKLRDAIKKVELAVSRN